MTLSLTMTIELIIDDKLIRSQECSESEVTTTVTAWRILYGKELEGQNWEIAKRVLSQASVKPFKKLK